MIEGYKFEDEISNNKGHFLYLSLKSAGVQIYFVRTKDIQKFSGMRLIIPI